MKHRYYIWGINEFNPNQIYIDNPSKAIILAADEFMLTSEHRNIPSTVELDIVLGGYAQDNYVELNTPKHATIHFWNTYWMTKTLAEFVKKESPSNKINKLYISLNHRCYDNRCMMMDSLSKFNLIENGYISWHRRYEPEWFNWKHWKPKLMILDDNFWPDSGDNILYLKDQMAVPNEYSQTLFNLVTESSNTHGIVSEKTYTAILSLKPFIIFGAPGIHRYLKRMGFLMYDELFDYSFDDIVDPLARADAISNNIKNLVNEDYYELRDLVEKKVLYNNEHLIHLATSKRYVPNIIKEYLQYLNKANDINQHDCEILHYFDKIIKND